MNKENETRVGIIGIGYVGLPLVDAFCKKGIKCIGFDIDKEKVTALNSAESFLVEPSNHDLKSYIDSKLFEATTEFQKVAEVNHIIICVPTPIDLYRKPDLSYVVDSTKSIVNYIQSGTLISLESTTYPGTTREIIAPILEESGLKIGSDIFLSFSPEREDPGNKDFNLANTPKVVSGYSAACMERAISIYSIICEKIVKVSSLEIAETSKLVENIQRAVNIGLMNELKTLTDKMDINIFEVIDAASTKPFGFTKYYPGPGVGGHCIPIDPFYLTYKAKEYNIDTKFIELAGEVNRSMPDFVIGKVSEALNRKKLSISQAKILCLGISYKKNVGDTRESPPVEIFDRLNKLGAKTDFSDPYFDVFPRTKKYKYSCSSENQLGKNLEKYDLVLLLTDHDLWDYDEILTFSNLIIDTRGRYHTLGIKSKKLVNA
tara:strand:- start:2479 stop:3774 length:1296 start_codon:yes stop_codon:yes gene_type:complete